VDYAEFDLLAAVAHHLLIFALAAILAFELAVVQLEMAPTQVLRLARVDIWYGFVAAAILIVGFLRAVYVAKGWAYYSMNYFFWAKIATFAAIGILSIVPSINIIRWKRDAQKFPASVPCLEDVVLVRRLLWLEIMGFALMLVFAAAMARGHGAIAH